MRYKFISGDWQNIRKIFPDWSFFICNKSPYINWLNDESGGVADYTNVVHYLIVASDIILDVALRFEPVVYKKG